MQLSIRAIAMSAIQLKIVILLLLGLMIASLFNGLFILFQDQGAPGSKRTFHRLVIRVGLATALLTTMWYGFYTGKLHSTAPWDRPNTSTSSLINNN
jgi:predicted secreted protein